MSRSSSARTLSLKALSIFTRLSLIPPVPTGNSFPLLITHNNKMSARGVSSSRGDPDKFFASNSVFAVVGASNDPTKFGNKVFKCYLSHNKVAVPISKSPEIEGRAAYPTLKAFLQAQAAAGITADKVGVSIITPPAASESVVNEGIGLGIKSFFLQPGTTNEAVLRIMDENEKGGSSSSGSAINFVEGCVLVELGCDT